MTTANLKMFGVFLDPYYWQTAVLISKNGMARQYRNSFLGMMWTLFQPLTMVFVYTFMMPLIMHARVERYPLYMVVSLSLWGFFSSALHNASHSLLSNGETLKRCIVSSTVFPVADVLRYAYTFFISFASMYLVAALLYGAFTPLVLLVPVFFIPVFFIIAALSIAIAFIAPYVRDVGDFILVCMNMLMWLTPVIYPISALPEMAQAVMQWNPFYIMMRPIQMLAYDNVLPGYDEVARLFSLTIISVLIGFGVYKTCRRNFVYYL